MSNAGQQRVPKLLVILVIAYCAASLLHFAHNAEFLADYPNMPGWLSRVEVYAAWLGVTALGATGFAIARTRFHKSGLLLVAIYAALGFDGLSHYSLAPMSAHTFTMNFTIWLEVVAAAVLLMTTLAYLFPRLQHRQEPLR